MGCTDLSQIFIFQRKSGASFFFRLHHLCFFSFMCRHTPKKTLGSWRRSTTAHPTNAYKRLKWLHLDRCGRNDSHKGWWWTAQCICFKWDSRFLERSTFLHALNTHPSLLPWKRNHCRPSSNNVVFCCSLTIVLSSLHFAGRSSTSVITQFMQNTEGLYLKLCMNLFMNLSLYVWICSCSFCMNVNVQTRMWTHLYSLRSQCDES